MNNKNIYKYDKLGRLIYYYWSIGKLLYKYKYDDIKGVLKEEIYCFENKSNYKTIIKHINVKNSWQIISKIELGDVYCTYFNFENNNLVFVRRFNRKTNTTMKKNIIKNSEGGNFWVMEYDGKKTIGFKINPNKIK